MNNGFSFADAVEGFYNYHGRFWEGTPEEILTFIGRHDKDIPPNPSALIQWFQENAYGLMCRGIYADLKNKALIRLRDSKGEINIWGNEDFVLGSFLRGLTLRYSYHILDGELHYEANPITLRRVTYTIFLGMVRSLGPTEWLWPRLTKQLFNALKAVIACNYLQAESESYTCPRGEIKCVYMAVGAGCQISDTNDACPLVTE